MRLVARGAAALGAAAHGVDIVGRGIVWFASPRVPWALVAAVLLGLGAWQSVEAARRIEAAQPRPEPVALGEVVDGADGWVGVLALVEGPFFDSSAYDAPVLRHYYLLTDPTDPEPAMVARSTERLEERTTRTIVARVVGPSDAAIDDGVDAERSLVEVAGRRPRMLVGEVATPETLAAGEGSVVAFRGDFSPLRPARDGAGWDYLAREGGRAVVVRSPYPPDALPVDVWGVATTDPLRLEQAMAVPDMAAAAEGHRVPAGRLLAEGTSPPVAEPSYLGAMILAGLGLLLATGSALGHPIFLRRRLPARVTTWPLAIGDELRVEIYGADARSRDRVGLDAAPGRLQRLDADVLERRAWQFSLHEAGAAPMASGVEGGYLALSSGQGPLLVRLEPPPADLEIGGGELVEVGRIRPAIRLRADDIDLVVAFETTGERDRALAALDPTRLDPVLSGPAPEPAGRARPTRQGEMPGGVRVAAIILAVVGAVVSLAGIASLPSLVDDRAQAVPVAAQLVIGVGLIAVARGVVLGRDWAGPVGFNVGWIGAAVAGFVAIAAPQCGLWLSPNLGACQAAGPIGVGAAVVSAIGLGWVALVLARHGRAFTS